MRIAPATGNGSSVSAVNCASGRRDLGADLLHLVGRLRVDEVARLFEVAVDLVVVDEACDPFDCRLVRLRVRTRPLGAESLLESRVHETLADGQLRRRVARDAVDDPFRLDQGDALAFTLQQLRSCDPGDTPAEDGHVDAHLALEPREVGLGRRGDP
jgi:hypothetical protein